MRHTVEFAYRRALRPNSSTEALVAMRSTAAQSLRYLIGAVIALGVDLLVVFLALHFALPRLLARAVGMVAGITTTYFFNRRYTFRTTTPASVVGWSKYVLAQSIGAAINYFVSSALLLAGDGTRWHVAGAVIAGAAAGFVYNFFAARRVLHEPQ
ncbi:MAG: GtrA family protein [Burkholderiales bacterium]|nr:MAG: GtrA family protein [Betaproteobacteria bacterium]TAG24442.1 MAG: GtrA family protein [Burkholderiales bacterium]